MDRSLASLFPPAPKYEPLKCFTCNENLVWSRCRCLIGHSDHTYDDHWYCANKCTIRFKHQLASNIVSK